MVTAAQLIGLVAIEGADTSIAKLVSVGAATDNAGAKLAGLAVGGAVLAGAALVALGAKAVAMDADLQQGVNRLRTGAGDTTDSFNSLRSGIQQVAVATGVMTDPLTKAMYLVVSSGQRGAQAMDTLTVAAKGAQIEQANVVDVANTLSGVMTNYGTKVYNATQYMNGLIEAVKHGKITLQDLSTAMGPIDPIAQQLGIHMQDVAAAMTTQTNAMIPAARAATGLRFMMQGLENPTKKARTEMAAMGLDSVKVAEEMKVSLPGALQMIYDAAKNAGPEGSVPFNRAISDMIGGVRGFTAFTALTGPHLQAFSDNVNTIAAAMGLSATQVTGWDTAQSNLNVQLDQGRAMLEVMGQNVGELLLPYVSQLLSVVTPLIKSFGDWATSTNGLAGDISTAATFVKDLFTALSNNGVLTEFGSILSDIGQTVQNVLNAAMLTLSGLFGTTATHAGSAADAANNVAGGFKHILDVIKPLTDAAAWLTSQFTDSGVKGQILRDVLVVIGTTIASIKVAEFGVSMVTALQSAGLAAQSLGRFLLGVQAAATVAGTATAGAGTAAAAASGWFVALEASLDGTATAATAAGTATAGAGTALSGMIGPLGLVVAGLTADAIMLKSVADESDKFNQAIHTSTQYVQGFSVQNGQMTREVATNTKQMADGTTKTVHTMVDTNLAYAKYGSVVWNTQADNMNVHTVTVVKQMAADVNSETAKMAIGGGNNISGMVAGIQGDMSNMGSWMANEWGTMARTSLSQASQLSDGASKMLAQLKDNTISDFSKMDASAIGYWNDIADYIAGHSINGNITYTAKSIGGQTVVNGQYQATGAPPGGQTKMSAEGWLNSPGGWSWVGERGAELMNVPRGASIFPHNQSVGMASSGGASSGRPVVIQFVVNGRQLANAALPDFVQAIRDHTGAKF